MHSTRSRRHSDSIEEAHDLIDARVRVIEADPRSRRHSDSIEGSAPGAEGGGGVHITGSLKQFVGESSMLVTGFLSVFF